MSELLRGFGFLTGTPVTKRIRPVQEDPHEHDQRDPAAEHEQRTFGHFSLFADLIKMTAAKARIEGTQIPT